MESFEWEGKPEGEKTIYGTMIKKKHKYILDCIKIIVYIHWHKLLGLLPSSTNEQIKVRTLFLRSSWCPKRNTGKHSHIGNNPLGVNYMVCKVFLKSDFLKNRTFFFLKLICYIMSNPQLMLIFCHFHHTFHNPMRLAADYLILWAKSLAVASTWERGE